MIAITLGAVGIGLETTKTETRSPSKDRTSLQDFNDLAKNRAKFSVININKNTNFNDFSKKITVNDFVWLIFDDSITNAELKNKMFIAKIFNKYKGKNWFIGKIYTKPNVPLNGVYSLIASEITINGTGTGKILWNISEKITNGS